MYLASLLVRELDGRERRADSAGRERSRVAVREHLGAVCEDGEAVLADTAAHGPVLFPNRRRFGTEALPHVGSLTRRFLGDAQHARERPAQVYGSRTGGTE